MISVVRSLTVLKLSFRWLYINVQRKLLQKCSIIGLKTLVNLGKRFVPLFL